MQQAIDEGKVVEETGPYASRNGLQTVALLEGWKRASMTPRSVAVVAMKKKRVRKNLFSCDAFGQWDLRISARSSGTSLMAASFTASTSAYFRFLTGRRWISGNTSSSKH